MNRLTPQRIAESDLVQGRTIVELALGERVLYMGDEKELNDAKHAVFLGRYDLGRRDIRILRMTLPYNSEGRIEWDRSDRRTTYRDKDTKGFDLWNKILEEVGL
ncbi:MAG: hypothetical protein AABX12_03085 [Nanoarchaeota archaeon]